MGDFREITAALALAPKDVTPRLTLHKFCSMTCSLPLVGRWANNK